MEISKSVEGRGVKLFDIQTTAAFLGVSRQTVNRMVVNQVLPAIVIRSGRRKKVLRIRDDVLRKFVNVGKNESFDPQPAMLAPKKPRRSLNSSGVEEQADF